MKGLFSVISVILYFIVGLICAVMAYKTLSAKKFLPFHEQAAGKSWKEVDKRMQTVLLTVIRISGLGFLVTALLLTVFTVVNFWIGDPFVKFGVPAVALVFTAGLFLFNYSLFRKTKAETPWQGSVIAMAAILAGLFFSLL